MSVVPANQPRVYTPEEEAVIYEFLENSVIRRDKDLLTVRQHLLLRTLKLPLPDNERTVGSLARRFKLQKPVITRALNSLIKLGLAKKRRPSTDKRIIYAYPTSYE